VRACYISPSTHPWTFFLKKCWWSGQGTEAGIYQIGFVMYLQLLVFANSNKTDASRPMRQTYCCHALICTIIVYEIKSELFHCTRDSCQNEKNFFVIISPAKIILFRKLFKTESKIGRKWTCAICFFSCLTIRLGLLQDSLCLYRKPTKPPTLLIFSFSYYFDFTKLVKMKNKKGSGHYYVFCKYSIKII